MEALEVREAFFRLIQRFNAGELEIPAMSQEIERLNAQGLHGAFANPKEARALYEYTWSLDFYRPDHRPRPGLFGRLRDTLGGPRFTAAQVKARGREIERVMRRHST
jgi:hypothetical protein